MHTNAMLFSRATKFAEALAVDLTLKGTDGAFFDGEGMVGYDEAGIDLNNAPEAAALRAGTDGRVEREKCGCGRAIAFAVDGGAESTGEGEEWLTLGIEDFDTTFT